MTCARFEVRLHSDTGLPEDDCVNVWHAAVASDVSDATLTTACDKLMTFYYSEQAAIPNTRISYYFSPTLKSGAGGTTFRVFTFDETDTSSPGGGPVIGAPRIESVRNGETDFASSTPLPEEVAICLSMTTVGYLTFPEHQSAGAPGPEGDIHPRARRRGRVYLGPLNSAAIEVVNSRPQVKTNLRTNIADAFGTLHTAMGTNMTPLQVFSRTDHAMRRVNGIWIDDAFDTVRRRGLAATTRTTRAYL